MTAGLSYRIPGHGAGICTEPISGSTMHTTGSTPSLLVGGVRTAMRSLMICGDTRKWIISEVCAEQFESTGFDPPKPGGRYPGDGRDKRGIRSFLINPQEVSTNPLYRFLIVSLEDMSMTTNENSVP
jgi:hypothetical protein